MSAGTPRPDDALAIVEDFHASLGAVVETALARLRLARARPETYCLAAHAALSAAHRMVRAGALARAPAEPGAEG